MEELKKFKELLEPDERNLVFSIKDPSTDERRPPEILDIYLYIETIELNHDVPEDVRSQFNVARNLAIYSWLSYSFHEISESKAYSTTEMALRRKLGNKQIGLKRLIKKAIDAGLIKDSGFSHIDALGDSDSTKYSDRLPEFLSYFRNDLAHGSTALHAKSFPILRICADIINQLYPKRTEDPDLVSSYRIHKPNPDE